MTILTKADWQNLKAVAATRWHLYNLNPFLPADVKAREAAKFAAYEEAADNALDLINRGFTLEEVQQMTADFLDWKTGGAA